MWESIRKTFSNYFSFSGRADRKEFWTWVLAILSISLPVVGVLAAFAFLFGNSANHPVVEGMFQAIFILLGLFWIVLFIPSLTVSVRRLRDAGITPWLLLIPAATATFTLLVLMDRALYNMSPNTPANYSESSAYIMTATAILVSIIFLILFCLPSKKKSH